MIAAGFAYLADSLAPFLLPGHVDLVNRIANVPLMLGEPAITLWFLIVGAKDQPMPDAAASPA